MKKNKMKKGIVGAGGFGNEVYWSLDLIDRQDTIFFVEDKYYDGNDELIKPLSDFNPNEFELVVAIGDPSVRQRIVELLPKETIFFTHINKSVQIMDPSVKIGEGSIICGGTILTSNIKIGKHSQLNLMTTIGHDTIIGDYITTSPGTKISGNCLIGDRVYLGTNTSIKEKITITNDVTIGLNSGVVKNINKSGVYVGTPTKQIK